MAEYKLIDVRNKLEEIQKSKKESTLFAYLKQLFLKKGYTEVQITHGNTEFGKDLVFCDYDSKLGAKKYYAVVVKNKGADQKDFEAKGEIHRQIQGCFKHPYVTLNGNKEHISTVIVIVNGPISDQALRVLTEEFHASELANILRWNYQELANQLFQNIPSVFLASNDPETDSFLENQRNYFLQFEGAEEIYHGLSVKDISDIYVNVRTSYNKIQKIKSAYTEYNGTKKINSTEAADDSLSVVHSLKSFLISGIATSGKSLLLKRIGYNSVKSYRNKPIAPFLFQLGKIKHCDKISLEEEIEKLYSKLSNGAELIWENYSKLCLLLDGFDEIRGEDNKEHIIKQIASFENEFKEKHKGKNLTLQIVLTTRDKEYFESIEAFKNYEPMDLYPFDVGQAFTLVKKLIPNDKIKTEKFIAAVKNNQLSNSLTRTPMALSLMAILYKEDQVELDELPANITELYNKFTDYYLNKWDTTKGLSTQYKFEESKQILAFIAKHLHQNGETQISYKDLNAFLTGLRHQHSYEDLIDLDAFLKALKDRVGIVQYSESGKLFSFSHHAFQEYFVSLDYDDSNEEELQNNFFDVWWSNTIVFYCGKQPKRDVFLKKVTDSLIPTAPIDCLNYLNLLSRSLQASLFVSNASKKRFVEVLIFMFNKFYTNLLLSDKKSESGTTYLITTLDLILQFRDFFRRLISSKHLNQTQVEEIILDILLYKRSHFEDVPLYCLAYYASKTFNSPVYLEEFAKDVSLNVRWDRIVFIDLQTLQTDKEFDEKTQKKIRQRQLKNQEYIQQQFKQLAYKHTITLTDSLNPSTDANQPNTSLTN